MRCAEAASVCFPLLSRQERPAEPWRPPASRLRPVFVAASKSALPGKQPPMPSAERSWAERQPYRCRHFGGSLGAIWCRRRACSHCRCFGGLLGPVLHHHRAKTQWRHPSDCHFASKRPYLLRSVIIYLLRNNRTTIGGRQNTKHRRSVVLHLYLSFGYSSLFLSYRISAEVPVQSVPGDKLIRGCHVKGTRVKIWCFSLREQGFNPQVHTAATQLSAFPC